MNQMSLVLSIAVGAVAGMLAVGQVHAQAPAEARAVAASAIDLQTATDATRTSWDARWASDRSTPT
jgi:hypothetical protein